MRADDTRRDVPEATRSSTQVPGVVALVFEQLTPSASQLAENAAKDFLNNSLGASSYAGVFHLDRSLHLVAPYSRDLCALLKGVRAAARRPAYALERAGSLPGAEFATPESGSAVAIDARGFAFHTRARDVGWH